MKTFIGVLAFAACNLDSTIAAQPDAVDAPIDVPVDENTPVPRCDRSKPFDPPKPVVGLDLPTIGEFCARLSRDQLTVYVTANDGSALEVFVSTRATIASGFPPLQLIAELNSTGIEQCPFISDDGLTIYFSSDRAGGAGSFDLYVAGRPTLDATFGPPARIANVNTAASDMTPYIVGDTLYYSSASDIFKATRNNGGAFGSPQRVAEVSTQAKQEANATVTEDDLVMYLSVGVGFFSMTDIFVAQRASKDQPFGVPVPVTELNTAAREEPNWISPDGCDLYFVHDTGASLDVLVAHKPM